MITYRHLQDVGVLLFVSGVIATPYYVLVHVIGTSTAVGALATLMVAGAVIYVFAGVRRGVAAAKATDTDPAQDDAADDSTEEMDDDGGDDDDDGDDGGDEYAEKWTTAKPGDLYFDAPPPDDDGTDSVGGDRRDG